MRYIYKQDADVSGDFATLRRLLAGDWAIVTEGTVLTAYGPGASIFQLADGSKLDVYGYLLADDIPIRSGGDGTDGQARTTINVGRSGVIHGRYGIAGLGNVSITNLGDISGDFISTVLTGKNSSLNNLGSMSGSILALDGEDVSITNSGTIAGQIAVVTLGEHNQLINLGLITGSGETIVFNQSAFAANFLINSGAISGGSQSNTVVGSNYADTIRNSGSIVGQIDLGAGDDSLNSVHGVISGRVLGGDGRDSLIGSEDRANRLYGGSGDDVLEGGDRADVLVGNAGADSLTGGAGRDNFVFFSAGDSTTATPDLITDFSKGDKIGLGAVDADKKTAGDQAFHIGQTDARTGDIVFSYDAASDLTRVDIFTNADAKIDMTILLSGEHMTLTAADFAL